MKIFVNFAFAFFSIIAQLTLISCNNTAARTSTQNEDSLSGVVDSIRNASDDSSVKPASAGDTLSFAFVGDIMMGTIVPKIYLPPNDGKNLFDDVKDILASADIAAGNLEGTVFDGPANSKKLGPNSYAFRTPASYVSNLVDAGFDFLGVANNHANDFGPTGRNATQENLKKAGIAYAGTRGVCESAVLQRGDLTIGFTQFGHNNGTLSILDYEELKRVVKELDAKCDIVVVGFHGGAEGKAYAHVPHRDETAFGERRGNVEKFAHTAIDAGADIVFGHGPHVPRAVELYNDRIIFYSLGNFCTPYQMNLSGISGYAPLPVVNVDKSGKFLNGKIHSFIQKSGIGPRVDSTNSVAAFMRTLSLSDFPGSRLDISSDGSISIK